mmetsp:Transcript_30259/g.80100  ORF Transcript_30259/g.80100 Transcript_30259/m.80100 type:complete len:210 (+) Transcript_30259:484-1113(+)
MLLQTDWLDLLTLAHDLIRVLSCAPQTGAWAGALPRILGSISDVRQESCLSPRLARVHLHATFRFCSMPQLDVGIKLGIPSDVTTPLQGCTAARARARLYPRAFILRSAAWGESSALISGSISTCQVMCCWPLSWVLVLGALGEELRQLPLPRLLLVLGVEGVRQQLLELGGVDAGVAGGRGGRGGAAHEGGLLAVDVLQRGADAGLDV